MKLDFLSFGGGGGGGLGGRRRLSRQLIERYMRHRLEVRPIDDARRPIRIGLIGAFLFFGLFLAFALIAPISGAAVAEGEVSVSGNRLMIQPEGSALISEILVSEGQAVREGQPLVRMNGIRSGAQLRQAQARRDALRALESRLIAERDNLDGLAFPPDLAGRSSDPVASAAMRTQQAIFARRREILNADRTINDAQLAAARARRAASVQQLALVEDELSGISSLYAKGFARKTTLRALQRSAAQLESDVTTGASSITEAEMNQRRTRDGQMMTILSELARAQEQLAQINPQLDVSRYQADRDLLRAPVSGRVAGLAPIGTGSVVNGGRTLLEILPFNRTLIVEARIKPADIDDVRLGAEAHVRFTTANPRGRSSFIGRVVRLSPIRTTDSSGQSHFRAQIALVDPDAAQRAGVTLQPGLPATVNITTQRRTLWDYLMSPFTDALSGGLREE
jgi:HlyD family type I secretion membrane fusion protein